ncbi:MAG: hypothetical protein Kow00127_08390 [Bacteroidales bacterium]
MRTPLHKYYRFSFMAIGIIAGLLVSCTGNQNSREKIAEASNEYKLVWQDEFDYSGLPDTTKWRWDTEGNEDGWGNKELQFYTDKRIENSSVDSGFLHITALREEMNGKKYTSARLNSKFSFQYGRVEVGAKLPDGRGTWSAIWMMPASWSFKDGNWPDIGEIDIMEHVGHDPGVVHLSAHSKDYQWQKGTQKTATVFVSDATGDFQNYWLEWSPDSLIGGVNDSTVFRYYNEHLGPDKWPYDKPFYLILNLAVGGEWGNVKGVDENAFPQTLIVDYVRVYQLKNQDGA